MSIANVAPDYTRPDESIPYWEPALTRKEAAKLGISKREYNSGVVHARMAAVEHQQLRTPRPQWEPVLTQNDHLADPFIVTGDQELAGRLDAEVNPALDQAQDLNENVRASLVELTADAEPIVAPETGISYSVTGAVDRVKQNDKKIERDKGVGKTHHDRASRVLQRIASLAPWVEAVGFLTFIDYYLNVPLVKPWEDWLGWSFAISVVLVIIVGQTWLVRHAARSHNQAREARADGHRFEADAGYARRNRFIGLTAVTAVAITSGMIWRGTAALGDASLGTTAVMIFVATVTGLLLPTLAYLGVAFDGSTASRERDSLAADLDQDLGTYLQTVEDSRRDLAGVAETSDALRDKTFPDICNTTQEAVDAVYGFYGTVRLLIGGLSADPPVKTPKTIGTDATGNIYGYIGTSIPGSRRVNLEPLFEHWHRMTKIEGQRAELLHQVDALPPHPWGTSRTS